MSTTDATWLPFEGFTIPTGLTRYLWLFAVTTYGVGDGVTTAIIVWVSPLYREANPILTAAIGASGGFGLLAVKILAVGFCAGISLWGVRDDDRFLLYLPPVALTVIGVTATLHNLSLLL
ncbi:MULTISPECIES: hypothetical protein [Salinibaculum]|uniref:hypothetical protein n=1 Tax=Salinibaculum TaxID=2732368 RepID=UPI0030CDA567